MEAAGGQPVLIAPDAGTVQAFDHLDKADTFEATLTAASADADDFHRRYANRVDGGP